MTKNSAAAAEMLDSYLQLFDPSSSRDAADVYAEDCVVTTFDVGYIQNTYSGLDVFLVAEDEIKDSVPSRIIQIKESWVTDGMVVYHADLIDKERPGYTFTFHDRFEVRDGRITRDWCLGPYVAEQPHPGLDGLPMARQPSPTLPLPDLSGSQTLEHTQATFDKYLHLYNTDHVRFIKEVYAADVAVRAYDMVKTQNCFDGVALANQAVRQFRESLPQGAIVVDESWVTDDLVTFDGRVTDSDRPEWSFPFHRSIEFRDGRVIREWTYGEFCDQQPFLGVDGEPFAEAQ